MTILHALAIYRKQRGISQAELAREVKCGRSMIALIETRRRSPSSVLLRKLCKLSGITSDEILEIHSSVAVAQEEAAE